MELEKQINKSITSNYCIKLKKNTANLLSKLRQMQAKQTGWHGNWCKTTTATPPHTIRCDSCHHVFATCGNNWQQLATCGNCWKHMATVGNIWQHVATVSNAWQQFVTHDKTSQHVSTIGSMWRQLAPCDNNWQQLKLITRIPLSLWERVSGWVGSVRVVSNPSLQIFLQEEKVWYTEPHYLLATRGNSWQHIVTVGNT